MAFKRSAVRSRSAPHYQQMHILPFIILLSIIDAYPWGPPQGYANNAPNFRNCTICHSGNVGTGDGSISFTGLPDSYTPGEIYTIGVNMSGTNSGGYGFQAIAMVGNQVAGAMALNVNSSQIELNGDYIQQSTPSASGSWVFDWIAPESNQGDIRFSASGLAAGYPSSDSGDDVYITQLTVPASQLSNDIDLNTSQYMLYSNYPNPFNPSTKIVYDISEQTHVSLTIHDIFGNVVVRLVNGFQPSGRKIVIWNGKNQQNFKVSAGQYFYTLKTEHYRETKRMLLIK